VLYVLSGRLNAEGFVFATLIDRPFVAPTMATLWYFGALPGPLALLFAIEDSASWIWTLLTSPAERRPQVQLSASQQQSPAAIIRQHLHLKRRGPSN
jgi:hypothetical protein